MKWFFTLVKMFFYIPVRIFYPIKLIGKKNLPKGTYISITNHLSGFDVIMIAFYLPGFRYFLAKKELEKKRFVGRLLRWLGAVYIDRHKLDLKGIKTSINCLKRAPLSIFPEGTRNHQNEQIQQVKGGAAMIAVKADSPIVPVMIHHRIKALRRNYIFIGESCTMPYSSKDRFNSQAMDECTKIIGQRMTAAKESLDILVETKTYRQYNKQILKQNKENPTAENPDFSENSVIMNDEQKQE